MRFAETCFHTAFYRITDYKQDEKKVNDVYLTLITAYPGLRYWSQSTYYYAWLLVDLAKKNNLEWELIAAKVWIESGFNSAAVSPCGAKGLLQLMEPTIQQQCEEAGIPYVKNETALRSLDNLILATRYIKQASEKELGIIRHIAGYYVGGPNWRNAKDQEYIDQYCTSVILEREKLQLIYLGLQTKNESR